MRINVVFSGVFHEVMGTIELVVELRDGSTVRDLVNKLIEINGRVKEMLLSDDGSLRQECLIIINGRDIHWLRGLDTELHSDDKVLIAHRVFLA
ncbi:MoaD/ThiS family protein [Vulcanisaeta thermophila]|uniref:MoaD/ThiS family protein n=1 Tax=Vulcanisaeta thermophila TaxID=867917 RepID=UPI000853220B|nr:MoaD/ThiS family protein [Vulcanisaeta thermophila]